MLLLTPADLEPFADIAEAKAVAMIQDATAMAVRVAPCLDGDTVPTVSQQDAVKAILRRAVLRWNDAGSGSITQVGAGPFQQSIDTTRASKSLFWPSEVNDLQAICRDINQDTGPDRAVFTINTGRRHGGGVHSPICDLYFGGTDCSCGSSLNGYRGPLYQFGEVMP